MNIAWYKPPQIYRSTISVPERSYFWSFLCCLVYWQLRVATIWSFHQAQCVVFQVRINSTAGSNINIRKKTGNSRKLRDSCPTIEMGKLSNEIDRTRDDVEKEEKLGLRSKNLSTLCDFNCL
jgi:hypothetical protein